MDEKLFETVVTHAKNSGFVYQGSEIYGGLSNTWDFGPLGVELKNNIKQAWWKRFIQESPYNVGIQSAILMNPQVWVASGHVGGFSDPLMDCKNCKTRHRADKLIEDDAQGAVNPGGWSNEEMMTYIREHKIACPDCGSHDFTDIRQFNLMFKTFQGVVEEAKNAIYLRPETAQGMFVNFKNVQRTTRRIFRTREFEQMELEFFTKPGEDKKWYEYYKEFCMNFLTDLGVKSEHLRIREHSKEELSHYSTGTSDIEYHFSFGWGELWGIADRTDFDLTCHQNASKQNMEYFDQEENRKYLPYCIEPAVGVERLFLTFMCDAYEEEQLENDTRVVLHLHPFLAPVKACIMPLSKKLNEQAMDIFHKLAPTCACEFDDAGSIGKRYRRQDAIGTPFCVTVDFETAEDQCVTVRDRDTMKQERVRIDDLVSYIEEKIKF